MISLHVDLLSLLSLLSHPTHPQSLIALVYTLLYSGDIGGVVEDCILSIETEDR